MALNLVRSPLYIYNLSTSGAYAILTLRVDNVEIYQVKKYKDASTGGVLFEVSELLRDYLDVDYSDTSTHSKPYNYTITWYNESGTFVTATGGSGFMSDGYGYFEEGRNPISNKGLLQSNNVVYRLQDSDVKVPVDKTEATKVIYLSNNDIVKEQSISTSVITNIEYVGSSRNSFKDRVLEDGGTFIDSVCLLRFDDSVDLDKVDTIRVVTSDGVENIRVKTITECRYKPIKVSFVNRYGAIQEVWFFKKSIESMNVKSENYKSNIVSGIGQYDTKSHQIRNFNVQSNFKLALNTGYVDESYNEVMKELLQSEKVWIEIDSVIKPVNVNTKSLTFKTSVNDKLVDYKIDIDYASDGIQNVR